MSILVPSDGWRGDCDQGFALTNSKQVIYLLLSGVDKGLCTLSVEQSGTSAAL
jgi:hypothetical protein